MLSPTSTPADVANALTSHGYLPDDGLATAIFLALSLKRPLLLEGEAGVGKTEVAKVLSRWTGGSLIRLQCYEGIDASQAVSPSCRGYITNAPDVRLNFQGGSNLPLILSVNSGADTTLVVNGPDGSWYCSDDEGVNGMNPMVRFNSPQSGRYEIWVGTYGSASLAPAQLHISELYSQ